MLSPTATEFLCYFFARFFLLFSRETLGTTVCLRFSLGEFVISEEVCAVLED